VVRSPQPTLERSIAEAIDVSFTQEQQVSDTHFTSIPVEPYPSTKPKTLRHRSPLVKATPKPGPQHHPMAARHHDHHASVQQNRSPRLEVLINRCQRHQANNLLDDRKQKPRLQYLAIALRPDKRFQIILSGSHDEFVCQVFETSHHCLAAAIELEEVFDLERLREECSTEAMENAEAIVMAHVLREQIELELGGC
jgi:hypothetical protein